MSEASAARVLAGYFGQQVRVIIEGEQGVRADEPDAVHDVRVASRRLRSALRTFEPLLDVRRTQAMRIELKWLGEELGRPRDAEVLLERLLSEVAELPPGKLIGPVVERLELELRSSHSSAHEELVEALDSPRFVALRDELQQLLDEPPFLRKAGEAAFLALPLQLRWADRRVLRRWKAARRADHLESPVLYHEVRKAAKAARYAWEACQTVFGASATVRAKAWKAVTESLGTVQDTVVSRQRLAELAWLAAEAEESTVSYDQLSWSEYALAQDSMAAAEEALQAAAELVHGCWEPRRKADEAPKSDEEPPAEVEAGNGGFDQALTTENQLDA